MIELRNFSKRYYRGKSVEFAVEDISFTLQKGKIYGLLGANGSGKSTILKALAGIHYPTEGKILISGKDGIFFDAQENPERIMEDVGCVPEISSLPPSMTVLEFLDYAASIHRLTGTEKKSAVMEAARECSLSKVLDKKISKISKGFQQRVSFAQALLYSPENLILDEPVTGLDPSQIILMRQLIKKKAQGRTVLMSTHLMQEVSELCDYIFILREGRIAAEGTEEEITRRQGAESLEQAFFSLTGGGSNEAE